MLILEGRYCLGGEIGAGAYGSVCRAIDITSTDRKLVAVKTVDLEILPPERRAFAARTITSEVAILKMANHPNVIRATGLVTVDTRRHIILELCEGPCLQHVLDARGALELQGARSVLRQCLGALRHLHGLGIIHRDMKPGNVMFVEPFADPRAKRAVKRSALRSKDVSVCQVKVVDFGLARMLPHAQAAARRDGKVAPGGSKHGGRSFGGGLRGLLGPGHSLHGAKQSPGSSVHGGKGNRSPGDSLHGNSLHGNSQHGSNHGSEHGGKIMSGLRALGERVSRSPGNSAHGGTSFHAARNFDWLARLEERFEVSAHGSQNFAPPEVQAAWRRHVEVGPTGGGMNATMGQLVDLTTHDAWALDVYALGLMLRYMLTGVEPNGQPQPLAEDEATACGCLCGAPPEPPFERRIRDAAELDADVTDLLARMTAEHAKNRINIQQALDHKWLGRAAVPKPVIESPAAARTPADEPPAPLAIHGPSMVQGDLAPEGGRA